MCRQTQFLPLETMHMKKMRVKSQTMINIRISRKLRSGFEIKVRFFGRSVSSWSKDSWSFQYRRIQFEQVFMDHTPSDAVCFKTNFEQYD